MGASVRARTVERPGWDGTRKGPATRQLGGREMCAEKCASYPIFFFFVAPY
eukprot:COSAG06_NODE_55996_length_287_cov_0.441489_1_plen_50_part_10